MTLDSMHNSEKRWSSDHTYRYTYLVFFFSIILLFP